MPIVTMPTCLNIKDRNSWAEFSGDYNPIHFDIDWANKLGVDVLVVHGMLAMLPLKQLISNEIRSFNATDKAINMTLSLKRPVPIGAQFQIRTTHNNNNTVRFVLALCDSDLNCYIGSCQHIENNFSLLSCPIDVCTIEPSELISSVMVFQSIFSFVDDLWIVIDAIIFSRIFRDIHFTEEAYKSSYMVLHSRHDVFIAENLSNVTISSFLAKDRLPLIKYHIVYNDEISGPNYTHITASVRVWLDGNLIIIIEVGLMKKYLL